MYVLHTRNNHFHFYRTIIYYCNYNFLYLLFFFFAIRFDLFKSIHSFITFEDNSKLSLGFFFFLMYMISFLWDNRYYYVKTIWRFSSDRSTFSKIFFIKNTFIGFFIKNTVYSFYKSYSYFYITLYYSVIFYVLFVTINAHYFEYELDEFLLLFRRFFILIVFLMFLYSIFEIDFFFKKF